jgi:hypothetical protein
MQYLIVCVYAVNMINHANTDNFVKSLAHGENNIDIWFYNLDTCSNLFSWVQKTFLKILVSTTIDNLYMNLNLENLGMPISSSKSRDLADENNKILTEWKWFETTVLLVESTSSTNRLSISIVYKFIVRSSTIFSFRHPQCNT